MATAVLLLRKSAISFSGLSEITPRHWHNIVYTIEHSCTGSVRFRGIRGSRVLPSVKSPRGTGTFSPLFMIAQKASQSFVPRHPYPAALYAVQIVHPRDDRELLFFSSHYKEILPTHCCCGLFATLISVCFVCPVIMWNNRTSNQIDIIHPCID